MSRLEAIPEIDISNQSSLPILITITLPNSQRNFEGLLPEDREACQRPFDGCHLFPRNPPENMFILNPKRRRPQTKEYNMRIPSMITSLMNTY
jgi:hypothetical protein